MTSINRDEFLDLGTHCSDQSCRQLDFLPFKCPSCALPFCSDHWRPQNHPCEKYDPILANNIIPSCPLCLTPMPYQANTSPSTSMDHHLSTSCLILHPHLKPSQIKGATPICAAHRCSTKMIVPIQCADCREKFCSAHRFGTDHACLGPIRGNQKSTLVSKAGKTSGSAGLAALRRAQAGITTQRASTTTKPTAAIKNVTKPSIPPMKDSGRPSSPSGISKAIGKMKEVVPTKLDKRALAERESARKALEARAKKGILSESEKIRYATLQALEARNGKKKEGCVVC